MDDHDYFAPMFDEHLHNRDIIPHFDPHNKICAYCNTEFQSRNQLFKHLGYHGLDIRKSDMEMEIVTDTNTGSNINCIKPSSGRIRCVRRGLKKKKEKVVGNVNMADLLNELRL